MIYKGCERKIILIKNPGNGYFDEAYFILKENKNEKQGNGTDMLSEANRIVNESMMILDRGVKKAPKSKRILYLGIGLLLGSGLTSAMFLLFL